MIISGGRGFAGPSVGVRGMGGDFWFNSSRDAWFQEAYYAKWNAAVPAQLLALIRAKDWQTKATMQPVIDANPPNKYSGPTIQGPTQTQVAADAAAAALEVPPTIPPAGPANQPGSAQIRGFTPAPGIAGWWEARSQNEKIGIVAGGVALVGAVVYALTRR